MIRVPPIQPVHPITPTRRRRPGDPPLEFPKPKKPGEEPGEKPKFPPIPQKP